MPQIETEAVVFRKRSAEFRSLLNRMQWDTIAFATAAKIKARSAQSMWRGERAVPDGLMQWLRSMATAADALPPPPELKGD
jgi:hypothetical protein